VVSPSFGRAARPPGGATPYAPRHSFCSLLLHEGRSVIYVAEKMGPWRAAHDRDLRTRHPRAGRCAAPSRPTRPSGRLALGRLKCVRTVPRRPRP